MQRDDLIAKMQQIWGVLTYPDIDSKADQVKELEAYLS